MVKILIFSILISERYVQYLYFLFLFYVSEIVLNLMNLVKMKQLFI